MAYAPTQPAAAVRSVITQESFAVAPHLLGLPLARPSRRLAAVLLDLLLVTLLVRSGGGILLGVAAGFVFFRLAARGTWGTGRLFGRAVKLAFRGAGALILFVMALNLWGRATNGDDDDEDERDSDPRPAVVAAAGLGPAPAPEGAPRRESAAGSDSLLAVAYAAAVERGDSAARDSLGPRLGERLAAEPLGELRGELQGTREELGDTRRELEREQRRGFVSRVLDWLQDLGLGFGWTGLYFTAFTALWKGQTPAKRLLGIRVVRLNGLPMTLWASFERFGGYAAGLFTGLLGFAQVYWDRNRQAIHDKITETVVIRERAPLPEPPPRPFPPRMPPPPRSTLGG
ncbi:MAG TPA: RDD family protein [Longimicrobiaceae bacterium]|nr:RDD family protein [Longimicrobiaceae bacterium]